MKPLGGFFELELGAPHKPYHADALSLWTGRACLAHILRAARPARAFVPFFLCDTALAPFVSLGVPYTFYKLDPALEPIGDLGEAGDALLYVNYFGLKGDCSERLARRHGSLTILDDTQAFFQRGYAGAWSFNSARKFFGVPDGAYAYGPGLSPMSPSCRAETVRADHLVNRLQGRLDVARRQFIEHEAQMSSDFLSPSILAERLLAAIDYDRARDIRRRNFGVVHGRLGGVNRLHIDLDDLRDSVPFCYPLFPDALVSHEQFWSRLLFVPQLWPEVRTRPGEDFGWERELARRLLPLPIDQRYGEADMNDLCDQVLEVLG